MPIAYTRLPSPLLADCQLTHVTREPIDAARAASQHSAYEQALAAHGCRVVRIPPLPEAPDGVFVEDMALLLDGVAVLTRPGAKSRACEQDSVAARLAADFPVLHVAAGQLDGGDVLRVGKTLYVGLSARTDAAGAQALADTVATDGFRVVKVTVTGCLHLKTAVTYLGPDGEGRPWLLAHALWADMAAFEGMGWLEVAGDEPWAANALRLGDTVLLPEDAVYTAARLRARGYRVAGVANAELRKAEAGLTCMSLIAETV
jgi:dimethylargininase